MKKIALLTVLTLSAALIFTGCGKKNSPSEVSFLGSGDEYSSTSNILENADSYDDSTGSPAGSSQHSLNNDSSNGSNNNTENGSQNNTDGNSQNGNNTNPGTQNSKDSSKEESTPASDPFEADVYQDLKDFISGPTYYYAYNENKEIELGGKDYLDSQDGWETFTGLAEKWGYIDKISHFEDFTPCDDCLLESGREDYYSTKAYRCTENNVTITIGYTDLGWESGGSGLLTHTGTYYGVFITVDDHGARYFFIFEQ